MVVGLYRQIPALINHRYGITDIRPVVTQRGGRNFDAIKFTKVKISLFKYLHQESGSAAGKPIVAETQFVEGAKYAKRVIYWSKSLARSKTVTVILSGKLFHYIVISCFRLCGQCLKFRSKSCFYFRASHAAESIIFKVKADIVELIQCAEYPHLRKFCHSGDKDKLKIRVSIFEYSIESGQRFTEVFLQIRFIECLKHGFVIFVYEYDHTASGLFVCTSDNGNEASGVGHCAFIYSIHLFPTFQLQFKHSFQSFPTVIFLSIQA